MNPALPALVGPCMPEKKTKRGFGLDNIDSWPEYKFGLLLGSLVLLFLLFPFLESEDIGRHTFILATTMILFASIIAVSTDKKINRLALAIIIPTIGLNWAADFTRNTLLYNISQALLFVSFIFTVQVLFRHLLKVKRVTHDDILGAISIYVLAAMAFSSLYLLADRYGPGSFVINVGPKMGHSLTYSDYMYYSFGTITTSGSGDIVEVGSFVRSLSMIEATMGIFYVAFIISKLVASFDGSADINAAMRKPPMA